MRILAQLEGDLPTVIQRFLEFNSEDALVQDYFLNPLFVRRLREEFGEELHQAEMRFYITETDMGDKVLISPRIVGPLGILNLGSVELTKDGKKEFFDLVPMRDFINFIRENLEEVKQ